MTSRMDAPFYHDDSAAGYGHAADYERFHGNKTPMTKKAMAGAHYFANGGAAGGRSHHHHHHHHAAMMSPPSGDPLKLASPELEHLIIQSNQGLVATGPASSSCSAHPFLYRNQATNEQEGFADGFVKALADLHKQNQLVGGGPMSPPPSCPASLQASYQRSLMSDAPVYTNLGSYGPGPYPGGQVAYGGGAGPRGLDAPQTVPEAPRAASPPSLSPIDLDTQERIKCERKKLRNRIAASKCRKRKLERISRLEDKVKVLKGQNSELVSTASVLREQVAQLKQKVMSHVTNGCHIAVGSAKAAGGGVATAGGGQSSGC